MNDPITTIPRKKLPDCPTNKPIIDGPIKPPKLPIAPIIATTVAVAAPWNIRVGNVQNGAITDSANDTDIAIASSATTG